MPGVGPGIHVLSQLDATLRSMAWGLGLASFQKFLCMTDGRFHIAPHAAPINQMQ
jgi:hypothetical protein